MDVRYLIISLIIVFLGFFGLLNFAISGFQLILNPIQFGLKETAVQIKDGINFFQNVKNVHNEYLNVLTENASLKSELISLRFLSDENKLLRDQLKLNEELLGNSGGGKITSFVLAKVLGNPQDITGSSIILNKGTRDGIKKGGNVIIGNNLVGLITEISERRSVASLITSPKVSMTVYDISVENKTEGLVVGQYGTLAEMTRILPSEYIQKGDLIVTSGKDGIFEPGFVVGEVKEVSELASEPLKSANLKTLVDFSKLTKVFIVLN